MSEQRVVETRFGPGRLHINRARRAAATLLLGHGAGGGVDSPDLLALARHLPGQDITVIRFEQPWRVAGRKVATPPATLDEALTVAYDRLRTRTPLILGGRSAGARSAARLCRPFAASALLAISFPLHPPGRPEKSRLPELRGARVPTLVVQGERDAMGRPEEFPQDVELVVVPEADHGLDVPARGAVTRAEAIDVVVESTLEWIVRTVSGSRPGTGPGE